MIMNWRNQQDGKLYHFPPAGMDPTIDPLASMAVGPDGHLILLFEADDQSTVWVGSVVVTDDGVDMTWAHAVN